MAEFHFIEKEIIEQCRLFFSQEVKIITLQHRRNSSQGPFSNGSNNAYTAIVLPKTCSLKSITQSDTSKILLESVHSSSRANAIYVLQAIINTKMAQIFPAKLDLQGSYIDKSAAHEAYSLIVPDNTQSEPVEPPVVTSSTQTTAEIKDDIAEDTTLSTGDKRAEEPIKRKGKIWRVVGYTPSGEPCIEEHEPETLDSPTPPPQRRITASFAESCSSEYLSFDNRTNFTPGTSVVSDSDTITPLLNDEHSPVECAEKLEEANKEITRLKKELLKAEKEIETLENNIEEKDKDMGKIQSSLFDVEAKCFNQEKVIEDYETEKAQSTATIESLSNEIAALKETIHTAQDAQATTKRLHEEELEQILANLMRTLGRSA